MKLFYEPTPETISILNSQEWDAGYSGGKDSSSLVTNVEWLRETKQIYVPRPRLIQSNTLVEEKELQRLSEKMMARLRKRGWECIVVTPEVHERLYCQILGRGLPPIHPAAKGRWCTRSTKIDPMKRMGNDRLMLTGVRYGESQTRDKKLGCGSGGECGLPEPGEGVYSPIIQWKLCQVIDWLSGGTQAAKAIPDLMEVAGELLDIYDVRYGARGFDFAEQEIEAARFGCIGCPAISEKQTPNKRTLLKNGANNPLNELYGVWHFARLKKNRCMQYRKGRLVNGPIRMPARKYMFERVMDIQRRAGITLITPEDERFIKRCWKNKVYPRGWSEADELTQEPELELIQLSLRNSG